MVVEAGEVERTEQAILEIVGQGTTSPKELIEQVVAKGMNEDVIRAAIWFLIDQGRLNLTMSRKLEIATAV
jgi:hypothetical protein